MRRFYLLAVLFAFMLALPTTQTRAEGNPAAGKMTGSIGDFVWRDQNSNGIQDGGEPGLANVYVELQTAAGGWVNAVFTNANGAYSFTGVAPGSYRVKFANPGGFFQSPENVGSDAADSDADMNGFSPTFNVAAGQVITNLDAGFRPTGTSTCSLTISGAAGNKTCNDNGTANNPADDVYTFEFTGTLVSNPNNLPVWGYKVQINNTTVYGMYGMPITIGPIPVSAGTLTWTLVDDDNPTCSTTGTVSPPSTCSNGGNCATAAVRTISNTPYTCGQTANLYGFWFDNLNVNLSKEWLWESGSMVENSNGTANIIGVIYNKTKVNAKFAVDIILSGRTFSAPAGSPKTDGACAGTSTANWYYYNAVTGHLTGINDVSANELAGASVAFTAFGPKAQFGTGASLRNSTANGGSSWLNYTVAMQPVNMSLQLSPNPAGTQGADFNFQVSGTPLTNCATTTLTLNCTSNITVTAAAGANSAVVNYSAPTATSTCTTGSVSVSKTSGLNSGSAFPVGTSTVCYQATDGCGNTKTCCFTVTVGPGGNVCDDVTSPGSIGSDEAGCPSFDPTGITQLTAPAGGSGVLEYVWLSSTSGCPTASSQQIPGATGPTFDPGVISQTTWYVRCVRRVGCTSYTGPTHETNCVKKEVKTTGCGGGGTPDCNAITITPGSGNIAIGGLTAPIIMVQVFNASWASVFNQTYSTSPGSISIPGLAAGVYYVKVNFLNAAWVQICAKDGYFTVGGGGGGCDDVTSPGSIGSDELACPPYDPANITQVTAPAGGSGALEYVWLSSTSGCPTASSQQIPGATGATFDPGSISQTTWYIRCVRRVGCPSYTGPIHESNCVKKEVKTSGCNTGVLTLNCTANITVTAAAGANSAVVSYNAATATSTCTTGAVLVTKTSGLNSGSAFPVGTSSVCYQATDGCGNVKTCCFTVTVNPGGGGGTPDCTTISITPGTNSITVGNLSAPIVSVQVFNASWTQVYSCSGNCAQPTTTIPSLPAGVYYVKVDYYTAGWSPICQKDGYFTVGGGGGSCTLTLGSSEANKICNNNGTPNTAADDTWTVDFTALVTANPNSLPTWGWTATIGGATVTGMYNMVKNLGPFPISAGNLTFTYTDDDNPTCSKSITIVPPATCSTPPTGVLTINCANNITVTAAQGANSAVVNYSAATATSTCTSGSVSVTKTSGLNSGSAFPVGTSTVCYQATDGCGNVKTCCFTITVNGSAASALTISCTNNITVTAAQGANSAVVNYSAATATSTCTTGSVTVTKTSGLNSGSAFPVGTSTVCYQATDGCGNVKTCCFTINVNASVDPCANETVPPTISGCPGNQSKTVAAKYTATNTDKCGTAGTYGMWLDFADGNLSHFSISNSMFWENADGSATMTGLATSEGNSNLKFNINVTWTGRVTAPPSGSPKSLDCTAQVSTYGNNVRFYTGMSGTLTGAGSACNGITFTVSRRGPSFQVGNGANLRSTGLGASCWYSMTKSGSNSGCPTVTEGDFNFNIASVANTTTATWTAPTATDNCGTPTLTSNFNSGATFPVGTTAVTYTATDAKNNKSYCTFNIVVTQVNPGGGFPGSGSMVDPAKCYYIKNKASGKVIDAEDRDGVSGTFANQWTIDNTSSEKWKFQDAGNGYFYIVSQYTGSVGKVLDIAGGSTANGAYLDIINANGQDCTKFCFQDAGNGFVYIVAKHSGKAIKLVSSPGTDGTQIFQQPISSGNEHQKWTLQEVSCTGALVAPNNTLTFNAYRKGLNSELKWINNTGDKNEFFDIERSTDGVNFTKIGRVDGKGGNAGDQLYFQTFDRNPSVGDNIYRLKMVWKDGTVSFSQEQTVRFDEIPAIGIYPNPAADELFVDLSQFVGQKVAINLVNNLGINVFTKTIKEAVDEAHRLDISDIHSGSYRIFIQSETSRPEVRQVIVEKF